MRFLTHPRRPFKVSQSLSQKRPARLRQIKKAILFPGPFLLKPKPSKVSLGSWTLAKVAKDPGKRAQVGQELTFPNPPSRLCKSVTFPKSEKTG